MASQVDHEHEGVFDKPDPPPKNKGRKAWLKTHREFLRGKENWLGKYNCERCGNHVRNPEVDHIKKRSTHPGLVHDQENLRIYCHHCHALRHAQE